MGGFENNPTNSGPLLSDHYGTTTLYEYNALGGVTSKTVGMDYNYGSTIASGMDSTTYTSYCGKSKLYQKHVEEVTRYSNGQSSTSETLDTTYDYYAMDDSNTGARGQLKEVYSPLYTHPQAMYEYDSDGRVSSLKTLHDDSSSGTYVTTTYLYRNESDQEVDLIDGEPSYGNPIEVIEDDDGIERTTQSKYSPHGWTVKTMDAASHLTTTDYFLDGQVDKVTVTDGSTTLYSAENDYTDAGRLTRTEETTESGGPYTTTLDYSFGRLTTYGYQNAGQSDNKDNYTWAYYYDQFGDRTKAVFTTPAFPSTSWTYAYEGYGHSCDLRFPNPGRWFTRERLFKNNDQVALVDYEVSVGRLQSATWNYKSFDDPPGGEGLQPREPLSDSLRFKTFYVYGNADQLMSQETWLVDPATPANDVAVAGTRHFSVNGNGAFNGYYYDSLGNIFRANSFVQYQSSGTNLSNWTWTSANFTDKYQ